MRISDYANYIIPPVRLGLLLSIICIVAGCDAAENTSQPVSTQTASDAHPNFSSDDSQLVYMSDGEIKIVEIASGKVTNLTNSPTADLCPDWSNDGMARRQSTGVFV